MSNANKNPGPFQYEVGNKETSPLASVNAVNTAGMYAVSNGLTAPSLIPMPGETGRLSVGVPSRVTMRRHADGEAALDRKGNPIPVDVAEATANAMGITSETDPDSTEARDFRRSVAGKVNDYAIKGTANTAKAENLVNESEGLLEL